MTYFDILSSEHFVLPIGKCKPTRLDIAQPTLALHNTPGNCATLLEIVQLCEKAANLGTVQKICTYFKNLNNVRIS